MYSKYMVSTNRNKQATAHYQELSNGIGYFSKVLRAQERQTGSSGLYCPSFTQPQKEFPTNQVLVITPNNKPCDELAHRMDELAHRHNSPRMRFSCTGVAGEQCILFNSIIEQVRTSYDQLTLCFASPPDRDLIQI